MKRFYTTIHEYTETARIIGQILAVPPRLHRAKLDISEDRIFEAAIATLDGLYKELLDMEISKREAMGIMDSFALEHFCDEEGYCPVFEKWRGR